MKLIIFCLISIYSNFAGATEGAYQAYVCNEVTAAGNCSKKCVKNEITFDFKIKSGMVMFVSYANGVQSNSGILDGCKVIDEKNWSCTSENELMTHLSKMAEGNFSQLTLMTLNGKSSHNFSCAVKRKRFGLF
jgi:hypothetical protein